MKEFFKMVLKFTGILLLISVVVIAGIITYSKITGKEIVVLPNPLESILKNEKKTILIAGLHPEGLLTDFIMVASYDPETGRANMMSIPRDTKITGSVDGKINSVYAHKRDINDLIKKVKGLTGIEIDNYVIIKTDIIAKAVDAVGGVTVDVPINMNYDDNAQNLHIHIRKGTQTLTKENAEGFVRFRKNNDGTGYPMGDVQRTKVQQTFIKALVSEALKPKNIVKIPQIITDMFDSVKTDLPLVEILKYVDDLDNFKEENITAMTLPGNTKDGDPYYYANYEETKKLVAETFYNTTPVDVVITEQVVVNENINSDKPKSEIKIEVLNGNGRAGIASKVGEQLKEEGYNVTKIGNYKTSDAVKTTLYDRTNANLAKIVRETLGKGQVKREIEDNGVDVTIILGTDY